MIWNNLRRIFAGKAARKDMAKKNKPAPLPQEETAADEPLPRWDLTALYPAIDSPELAVDMRHADALAAAFEKEYKGTIAQRTAAELGAAIARFEEIAALRQKISAYVILLEADHIDNFAKTGAVKKWQESQIEEKLRFFEKEVSRLKERDLMTKLADPALSYYAPWVASVRDHGTKPLPDDVDALETDYGSVNYGAWQRLYHETMQGTRLTLKGAPVSIDEADSAGQDAASTPEERRAARAAVAAALKAQGDTFALIYNTLMKDGLIDGELRGYTRVDQETHLQNNIDTAVVDTMLDTVRGSYARLAHRYQAWRAQQHGTDVMTRETTFAKLPGAPAEKTYPFEEGKKVILRAFRKFSPRFSRIAQRFFTDNKVDAGAREGKDSGGFALSHVPGQLPFITVNYNDSVSDVATLGHELGHGVHQYLCEKKCGLFLSNMPIPIAETASVFAEMLVFDELLRAEKDPVAKKKLLSEKIDGMLSTGLQQLSFYEFERRAHEERRLGEVSFERLSDIWVETQKEYWGPSVELDAYDRYYWTVVPHFFDTPFYVYSYAFAQQQVSGLYQVYKEAERQGTEEKEAFVAKYITLLETGMTCSLNDTLRPFGLDPEKPAFWENGLSLVDKYLQELVKLDDKKPAPRKDLPKPL